MSYHSFLKNVEKFKPFEIIAGDKICILNNTTIKKINDDYKYDFETIDNIKYEVKTDMLVNKTNNFFIEFIGRGKPSGIDTTEAAYYILNDSVIYYLIDVQLLKKLVVTCRWVKNKDNSATGYLINKNIIIENSVII